MRNYLPFLINRESEFEKLFVDFKELKRKSYGGGDELDVVVATIVGVNKQGKYALWDIDSGKDDFNWGHLGKMLLKSKDSLEDFSQYRYDEIKKPTVDYWVQKQKAAVDEQKRKGAKTIWTPAGDYTLGVMEAFISRVLLAKYITLKDRSILNELKRDTSGFEEGFDKSVLIPLKAYMDVEDLVSSEATGEEKAKKIVDYLVNSELNNQDERILDPDYEDDSPFLTREEQGELNALWKIQSEVEEKINSDKKLSKMQKRIKMNEFYRSPQGKQLSNLNSARVRGGRLNFEEKEEKKKQRMRMIAEMLEEVLTSWGISYKDCQKGVEHYHYLYEKELTKRWEQEEKFNKVISKSKKEMEEFSEALEGNWNSNNLTLFGVILSIALSVGFGIASMVPYYKVSFGIAGGILSIFISILVIKTQFMRKRILLWMNSILK